MNIDFLIPTGQVPEIINVFLLTMKPNGTL